MLNLLKSSNIDVAIISGDLIIFLLSLYMAINKPFKDYLKELYIFYCIENRAENIKIS